VPVLCDNLKIPKYDRMLTTNIPTCTHLKLSNDSHVDIIQNDVTWHEAIDSTFKTVRIF